MIIIAIGRRICIFPNIIVFLNTLIRKGKYTFTDLHKIYCIGILVVSIFPHFAEHHNVATLKNENGELVDDNMSFITVELDKFTKTLSEVETDLDKLREDMQTVDTITEPTQYPAFWNEEWLKRAIDELDTRKMTPEERAHFARVTAANAEAVKAEQHRIDEVKTETITNLLALKILTTEQIANSVGVSVDFVLDIQQKNG